VLEDGDTLLSAIDFADLPGEDEGFTPLTDTELVELVLSDNAPGLVDVLDTDGVTYNLTACLEALELIQITLSANGAFSAEIELADVVDDVSFVQRNTVKQAQITQFFSATGPTLYTFDLYPEVSQPHFDNAKLMPR
jgi:hypothetical protein